MKFTLSWLKDFLDTDANLDAIVEKLTAIGLEVEHVDDPAQKLGAFEIAYIEQAEKHPDADKLQKCQVKTAKGTQQIVCGAPNARAGINVVLAPVGSIIPTNGMKIKASKIRGVESNGMLCSAAELGLGADSAGIIEMEGKPELVGKRFVDVEGLHDPIIEIAITPNRGDCLGVYGIARDLAAAGLGKLKTPKIPSIKGKGKPPVSITIKDNKACPLFMGRYFKGVKNPESPDWLKRRLESIGLRPISALVDITNYIAFCYARPLHVYDVNKLKGNLTVRSAKKGETIEALNDQSYELDTQSCVIADDNGPQAIAGIVGGEQSGCDETTTEVLLELALFDSIQVAQTGRKYGIVTDSRYRFERGVDSQFVDDAIALTTQMILDLCGGEASEVTVAGNKPKWQKTVKFDRKLVASLGGLTLKDKEIDAILKSLGFTVKGNNVDVPSWRPDIEGGADLVEEVLRIKGFEHIEAAILPPAPSRDGVLTSGQKRVGNSRRLLASRGMVEAVTWSFMHSAHMVVLGVSEPVPTIQNPISSELDVMRPTVLANLMQAVKRNADRGYTDLALFEVGAVYHAAEPGRQSQAVSGIRAGHNNGKQVHGDARVVDCFDAKADVLAVLQECGVPVDNLQVETKDLPNWYHPGQAGALKLGKNVLAYFGAIHPALQKYFDVAGALVGFEVFIEQLPPIKAKKSKSRGALKSSDYQASQRDFAFIVNQDLAANDLIKAVRNTNKELISDVSLFDVYQGKGVEDGKKSLAISIRIAPKDRTLTEAEIDAVGKQVIDTVSKRCNGVLRG